LNNHLIIFIKNPQIGKVKTRIAQTLGNSVALDIYLRLLEMVHEQVLQTDVERHLFYSNFIDQSDTWSNTAFVKQVQKGSHLGERMKNAFKTVFEKNRHQKAKKVIIIGSDCPYLSSFLIMEAFEALKKTDFVIGPTFDGGYYLLGMNQFVPSVFEDVNWSTEYVIQKTLDNIVEQGCTFLLLPTLHDIDTEADWIRFTNSQ